MAPAIIAGCASLPAYEAPTGGDTASLEIVKSPTSAMLHGTGFTLFSDADCNDGASLGWMTWVTQKSRLTRVRAADPLFVHVITFGDRGDGVDVACLNLVGFTPEAGRKYSVEQITDHGRCHVVVTDQTTRQAVPTLTPEPRPGCKAFARNREAYGRYRRAGE